MPGNTECNDNCDSHIDYGTKASVKIQPTVEEVAQKINKSNPINNKSRKQHVYKSRIIRFQTKRTLAQNKQIKQPQNYNKLTRQRYIASKSE